MKCISVKNPWAWLIIYGGKDVENRTWETNYRGRLLIHASRKWDATCEMMDYPCGVILGEVTLKDIVTDSPSQWAERGLYHWLLENPIAYNTPMPANGSLGLWQFTGEIKI